MVPFSGEWIAAHVERVKMIENVQVTQALEGCQLRAGAGCARQDSE